MGSSVEVVEEPRVIWKGLLVIDGRGKEAVVARIVEAPDGALSPDGDGAGLRLERQVKDFQGTRWQSLPAGAVNSISLVIALAQTAVGADGRGGK